MPPSSRKRNRPLRTKPKGPLGQVIYDAILRARLGYAEAVELVNKAGYAEGDKNETITRTTLTRWLTGTIPQPRNQRRLSIALRIPIADIAQAVEATEAQQATTRDSGTMTGGGSETERRDFLLHGAKTTLALFAGGTYDWRSEPVESPRPIVDPLTILEYPTLGGVVAQPHPLGALRIAVADAKRAYQACHYAAVASSLPQLLANLNAAIEVLSGDDRRTVYALTAEAYHVAASLLLKHEDHGPAWMVADRSMQAAERSGDPLIVASSTRILTHVFMSTGHNTLAATMATKGSQRLSSDWKVPTADELSVYGSLLLRGAVAAARDGNRSTTHELIDEAHQAARRLGKDDNRRWTAFGPTNVRLHEVHVAVRLGDAGTAIELARKIDLDSVALTERKASLLLDAAVALLQWGRVDQSYRTLCVAQSLAPEEMAARPMVRQLIADLVVRAPSHLVQELKQLVAHVGADRLAE